MKIRWLALAIAVLAFGPVVALAPPPRRRAGAETIDDLVGECLATGARGRDLVDAAMAAVARAYPVHSAWHLWESPSRSLAAHRGWSQQYNTVLLMVLRRLGFRARLVHAARVRGFGGPWWVSGHAWVKVSLNGRQLDACASHEGNRAGACGFVPLTAELPMRLVTRLATAAALMPFVVREVWAAWITRRPVAEWVYRNR